MQEREIKKNVENERKHSLIDIENNSNMSN